MSSTTPGSLLERLRLPDAREAWDRLIALYAPLLYYWARRVGVQETDAADLTQEVFLVLVRKLPDFSYDRHKSFRGWLRTVTLNKWREQCRSKNLSCAGNADALDELAVPAEAEAFWEREYHQLLAARAIQL